MSAEVMPLNKAHASVQDCQTGHVLHDGAMHARSGTLTWCCCTWPVTRQCCICSGFKTAPQVDFLRRSTRTSVH